MKQYAIVGVVACLLTVSLKADNKPNEQPLVAQKTALIDMAEVFKASEQFVALRTDLTDEIAAFDKQAKKFAPRMKTLADEIKKLPKGTDEHVDAKKKLRQLSRELADFRSDTKQKLMVRESNIYRDIYKVCREAVAAHAEEHQFTLVLRFQRRTSNESTDPGEVIKGMNRQVVYHDSRIDITDTIIKSINDEYEKVAVVDGAAR